MAAIYSFQKEGNYFIFNQRCVNFSWNMEVFFAIFFDFIHLFSVWFLLKRTPSLLLNQLGSIHFFVHIHFLYGDGVKSLWDVTTGTYRGDFQLVVSVGVTNTNIQPYRTIILWITLTKRNILNLHLQLEMFVSGLKVFVTPNVMDILLRLLLQQNVPDWLKIFISFNQGE